MNTSQTVSFQDPASVLLTLLSEFKPAGHSRPDHQLKTIASLSDADALAERTPVVARFYYNDYTNPPVSTIQEKEFVFTTKAAFKRTIAEYRHRVSDTVYLKLPELGVSFKLKY